VNAGDGTHEHPSAGLLDALTTSRPLGTIKNLNVTILGDILHSACAFEHSSVGKIWMQVHVVRAGDVGSRELRESRGDFDSLRLTDRRGPRRSGRHHDAAGMQTERLDDPPLSPNDYVLLYQLNAVRLRQREPECDCAASGPMNRGIEITPGSGDDRSRACSTGHQTEWRFRMTILYLLIGEATESGTHPALEVKSKESTNAI